MKNLGEWRGCFTSVSPSGELLNSTPSILNLEGFEDNQLVRFRLRRFTSDDYVEPPISDHGQEYRSVGRQVVFFDTGAFSKGSLQLAPFSEFGAEYGFVAENRRLRFVQLYDNQGDLHGLTLIREFRAGTDSRERPSLTVDQVLGKWQGTACTVYADWKPAKICPTYLQVLDLGGGQLQQKLCFRDHTISSTGRIEGNTIHFQEGISPRKILLLPDGASSNTPLQLKLRQPFFLECGWLVEPNQRQRLMRSYNEKGEWVSATHVIEFRSD